MMMKPYDEEQSKKRKFDFSFSSIMSKQGFDANVDLFGQTSTSQNTKNKLVAFNVKIPKLNTTVQATNTTVQPTLSTSVPREAVNAAPAANTQTDAQIKKKVMVTKANNKTKKIVEG